MTRGEREGKGREGKGREGKGMKGEERRGERGKVVISRFEGSKLNPVKRNPHSPPLNTLLQILFHNNFISNIYCPLSLVLF